MPETNQEHLEHVIVELNDHYSGNGAERMWAKPLGNNLYEVRNVPFYSYDVNFGDIVHAIADQPDHWPTVDRIHMRSGHKTLRIFIKDEKSKERVLDGLNPLKAYYENCDGALYAVNVNPDADYQKIIDYLDQFVESGVLGLETTSDKREMTEPG
jgi:hypothetical protein